MRKIFDVFHLFSIQNNYICRCCDGAWRFSNLDASVWMFSNFLYRLKFWFNLLIILGYS